MEKIFQNAVGGFMFVREFVVGSYDIAKKLYRLEQYMQPSFTTYAVTVKNQNVALKCYVVFTLDWDRLRLGADGTTE